MKKIRPRHVLIFLLVVVVTPASAPRAQNDDVLARENDDKAATIAQRQQALTTLLAAAQQARTGDPAKAAAYLNRAARLQVRLNLSEQAFTTFQDASSLLEQAPNSRVQVETLNGIGAWYTHLSKCAEAQPFLDQAIALSEQSGNVAGKAEALVTRSDCQGYTDPALALQTAQTALDLSQSIDDQRGMAFAYTYLSDFQIAQHQLDEATKSNQAALAIWRQLQAPEWQAEALISLGFIEYRRGSMQESLVLLGQARELLDAEAEPYKMGQITSGMGEAFVEIGLPETGLVKFKQGLEYFQKAENPRAALVVSWDIGKASFLMGNYAEALTTLQKTLDGATAMNEIGVAALSHDFLGRTSDALGDQPAALNHFHLALDLYSKLSKRREAARVLALIAQLEQRQGKTKEAETNFRSALATFRALSDRVNESAVLYAMGSEALHDDNIDLAEKYLRQSLDVTENIRRVSTSSDLTAAFSAAVYDRYEGYIECLMRKHQAQPAAGLVARAFEISELARARSLAELLEATQTNLAAGVDPQLAAREKFLRQSLRVKENDKIELLGKNYRPEDLASLERELAQLESQYNQIIETIRARYPAYDQISRPTAWNLQQIQEQIIADDDTVLLEYSLGRERSYVWAVTRDKIMSYELPPQAQINEASQKAYKLLSNPASAQNEIALARATQELGHIVLEPVAAELSKHRVIIVADGALNYVPFQLLPSPNNPAEPLVANYEVNNVPSASILGQLRQETARRQAPEKVLAAFGDPVFPANYAQRKNDNRSAQTTYLPAPENERWQHALRDIEAVGDSVDPSTLQPLFYATGELANLRTVAGSEILMATGFDATREKLTEADLSKFAILHFATHGILDPKRPENSGLFLSMVDSEGHAQNGFVGLQDIYRLHAPVDLVVLSACRTGLGKDVRGEGLIGLTRGFMYAGASSVVASLWKVDDEATAELMKRFYANMLQGGMPPATALRAAQNSIRQEPQWRSPYFWAAFTLQGEYLQVINHTPPQPFPRSIRIAIALSLLLLLAVGLRWFWRGNSVNLKTRSATLP
jgi:CHAT domain-containing protein